ncbi:hypothetical protein TURU_024312 [Turdus rufiventris]|nr:hypothetical protein TURU_024312 [Turdus rufiventris]
MGNAGSVDAQQTELRAHSVPLKLPMPEPGELEERFAVVLCDSQGLFSCSCLTTLRSDSADPDRVEEFRELSPSLAVD